ncbi:uncharacterized protein [Drosophila kikkawai]|uniref:Uncharacterized protein n=1 Tax=Drosophila kikkawai TaxID=30033 RepID=A0A6P4IED7_DROKI|nr:uncharacterized protein LOC108073677 [Drosophila kikkawai]
MLNGKFYTGLPPKMVERQAVKVCNRQESHFFWPDDSRADSAVENRVKRRNSQQLAVERPLERLSSVQNPSPTEVDTRRMFHKEFASSSIQFYDNLQSNPAPGLRRGTHRELTPKLTEVKPLEERMEDKSMVDATASRRQQAYSSKIQFYDYVNEADNATQNNVRRPQMDLNDKREVELNSKNSPKLQVKRNVRSFSVELEPKVTKKPLNDSPEWRPRPRPLPMPKKILKQSSLQDQDSMDFLDNRVRRLQLTRSPGLPKKHVTYNEEAAEYAYYEDPQVDLIPEPVYESRPRQQPNMPTGSRHQQQQNQQFQQQYQRQQQPRSFMETSRAKPLNNNNNYHQASGRKILPKLSESPAATTHMLDEVPSSAPAADPRKHLRSSLCFSGDALMVGGTPAAQSAQRSSAGQRISVGLPD